MNEIEETIPKDLVIKLTRLSENRKRKERLESRLEREEENTLLRETNEQMGKRLKIAEEKKEFSNELIEIFEKEQLAK